MTQPPLPARRDEQIEAMARAGQNTLRRAPVQDRTGIVKTIPWEMHLRAYAVYAKKWAPQQALIEGGCRGGFGTGELDDFIPGWRDELPELETLAQEVKRLRAALAAASPSAGDGWRPTHRHVKRGGEYEFIGQGKLQTDGSPLADDQFMIIYRGFDGKLWVRSAREFQDGRFEPLPPPPAEGTHGR